MVQFEYLSVMVATSALTIDIQNSVHGPTASFSIGTPPQPISALLDTGSANAWVRSSAKCRPFDPYLGSKINGKLVELSTYNDKDCPDSEKAAYDNTLSTTAKIIDKFAFYSGYGSPRWAELDGSQECPAKESLASAHPHANWANYNATDYIADLWGFYNISTDRPEIQQMKKDHAEAISSGCRKDEGAGVFPFGVSGGSMPYGGPVIRDVLHAKSSTYASTGSGDGIIITFQETQDLPVNYVMNVTDDDGNTELQFASAGSFDADGKPASLSIGSTYSASGLFGMSPSSKFAAAAGLVNFTLAQHAQKMYLDQEVPAALVLQDPGMVPLLTGMKIEDMDPTQAYQHWFVQAAGFKVELIEEKLPADKTNKALVEMDRQALELLNTKAANFFYSLGLSIMKRRLIHDAKDSPGLDSSSGGSGSGSGYSSNADSGADSGATASSGSGIENAAEVDLAEVDARPLSLSHTMVDSGYGGLYFPSEVCDIYAGFEETHRQQPMRLTFTLKTSADNTQDFSLVVPDLKDAHNCRPDRWILGTTFFSQMVVAHSFESNQISVGYHAHAAAANRNLASRSLLGERRGFLRGTPVV